MSHLIAFYPAYFSPQADQFPWKQFCCFPVLFWPNEIKKHDFHFRGVLHCKIENQPTPVLNRQSVAIIKSFCKREISSVRISPAPLSTEYILISATSIQCQSFLHLHLSRKDGDIKVTNKSFLLKKWSKLLLVVQYLNSQPLKSFRVCTCVCVWVCVSLRFHGQFALFLTTDLFVHYIKFSCVKLGPNNGIEITTSSSIFCEKEIFVFFWFLAQDFWRCLFVEATLHAK